MVRVEPTQFAENMALPIQPNSGLSILTLAEAQARLKKAHWVMAAPDCPPELKAQLERLAAKLEAYVALQQTPKGRRVEMYRQNLGI
jgi:hypothetical protein